MAAPANEETELTPSANTKPHPLPAPLILKSDDSKLLYFRAGSQTPETISTEDAAQNFKDDLILVAKEATAGIRRKSENAAQDSPADNSVLLLHALRFAVGTGKVAKAKK